MKELWNKAGCFGKGVLALAIFFTISAACFIPMVILSPFYSSKTPTIVPTVVLDAKVEIAPTGTLVPTKTFLPSATSTKAPTNTPRPTNTPNPLLAYRDYLQANLLPCAESMSKLGDLSSMAGTDTNIVKNAEWRMGISDNLDLIEQYCVVAGDYEPVPEGFTETNDNLKKFGKEMGLTVKYMREGIEEYSIMKIESAGVHLSMASGYMERATVSLKAAMGN